jgi:hypothetical protein
MVEVLRYMPEGCGFDSRYDFLFFFSAHNPSRRTMAPEFTQPVTKMGTGRILGVKYGRRVRLIA